jgi:hypothetical protein
MDSFTLSSNGANDITCNNITADNISVLSSLTVSGSNILSSINRANSFIGTTSSSLNITGNANINFNVGTQFTKINLSGLSVFHDETNKFPYAPVDWYNISDRLDKLYPCMSDTPNAIINYDVTHNTVLRIGDQDTLNQIYYPRQVQIQTYQGATISKFEVKDYNYWMLIILVLY